MQNNLCIVLKVSIFAKNSEDMEKEIFKWIDGYEGLYQITSLGRVYSVPRKDRFNRNVGGFLTQHKTINGYCFVNLYKDGKKKMFYVHRLVSSAFVANIENKRCVDHINGDKSDNRIFNLRWVTYRENMNNPVTKQMRNEESYKWRLTGSKNAFSRSIDMYDRNMNFIKSFECVSAAAEEYNIPVGSISRVCLGQRPHTHGYVFKYSTEPRKKVILKGHKSVNAKVIRQYNKEGVFLAEYNSLDEAAMKLGINAANISRVANGHSKSYKGCIWRFK